ncbi:hypothetical protein GOP47_0029544 [Adiantum capillus-veneris]|nr:hypothetical protein GOP47_0029544 [Adiantum capillus-veneris]
MHSINYGEVKLQCGGHGYGLLCSSSSPNCFSLSGGSPPCVPLSPALAGPSSLAGPLRLYLHHQIQQVLLLQQFPSITSSRRSPPESPEDPTKNPLILLRVP